MDNEKEWLFSVTAYHPGSLSGTWEPMKPINTTAKNALEAAQWALRFLERDTDIIVPLDQVVNLGEVIDPMAWEELEADEATNE